MINKIFSPSDILTILSGVAVFTVTLFNTRVIQGFLTPHVAAFCYQFVLKLKFISSNIDSTKENS
jgi:hypothetical protein